MNGPIPNIDVSVNTISSDFTVMKLEARVSEYKMLAEEIHLNLDTIKEIENSVLQNFMDDIQFEIGRY